MTDNKYWLYLEQLRKSGRTNMYASASYLRDEFHLTDEESVNIVSDWMDKYNPDDYKG